MDLRRSDHGVESYTSIDEIIQMISKVCFMPLAFGGGIRTLEQVDHRIQSGADKVIINTGAYQTPELVTQIAKKYGSQCAVISVDYRLIDDKPVVFTEFGTNNTGLELLEWINRLEDLGAGEIFLNSIDRDGMANGFDIMTINKAVEL